MSDKVTVENKLTILDIGILILSIYVLIALIMDSYFKLSPEMSKLLTDIDNFICVFFLYDFFYRLYKAKSKKKFLKWGWIDFIASLPSLEIFRYGRLIRVFRLLRVLRAFRSVKYLSNHLFKNRKKSAISTVSLLAVLMVIFGSIAILQVENDIGSNIKSAEDAIWWAFVTITTVGYGDKYPVTSEGRIIAAFLMTTGVGLFATFTGLVASWFMDEDKG